MLKGGTLTRVGMEHDPGTEKRSDQTPEKRSDQTPSSTPEGERQSSGFLQAGREGEEGKGRKVANG